VFVGGNSMLVLGIKLKPNVDPDSVVASIDKLVPDLQKPTRRGALTSLVMYRSNKTEFRTDEFVLTLEGFVTNPPIAALLGLCDVVYTFDCEPWRTWPTTSATTK
jgi:hypothetical protein